MLRRSERLAKKLQTQSDIQGIEDIEFHDDDIEDDDIEDIEFHDDDIEDVEFHDDDIEDIEFQDDDNDDDYIESDDDIQYSDCDIKQIHQIENIDNDDIQDIDPIKKFMDICDNKEQCNDNKLPPFVTKDGQTWRSTALQIHFNKRLTNNFMKSQKLISLGKNDSLPCTDTILLLSIINFIKCNGEYNTSIQSLH